MNGSSNIRNRTGDSKIGVHLEAAALKRKNRNRDRGSKIRNRTVILKLETGKGVLKLQTGLVVLKLETGMLILKLEFISRLRR